MLNPHSIPGKDGIYGEGGGGLGPKDPRGHFAPGRDGTEASTSDSAARPLRVAIVDSGVYPHSGLKGRLTEFVDLVNGLDQPYDDYGHGTHLAGLITQPRLIDERLGRLEPDWEVVVVKVLNREGVGRESTIIRGINWCLDSRDRLGIRVLNLSLGGAAEVAWHRDPLCRVVEEAWAAGLVVVTTAGNEGSRGPGSIRSPGNSPSVITVGALGSRRRVASFSSRGPTADGETKPDVVAVGTRVLSWRAPGSFLDLEYHRGRVGLEYFRQTGSSVSTAAVSGLVAAVLTEHPELTPDQVKELLRRRAVDLGVDRRQQGFGMVDPVRLLAADPVPPPVS